MRAFTLLTVIIINLACSLCYGAVVTLDDKIRKFELSAAIEYKEDALNKLGLQGILSDPDPWPKNDSHIFNQGYTDASWWLRFQVENISAINKWLLVISYPVLDDLSIYQINTSGKMQEWHLGDKKPFHSRPIDNRNFVVPIQLANNQTTTFYIRVKTSSSLQVPITIWQPEEYNEEDSKETFIHGIFYGALIIIAIYNLLLFSALKDTVYILYVGYMVFMGLFSASLGGWAYQYLWPNAYAWGDQALLFTLAMTMLFANAFISRFITRMLQNGIHLIQLGLIGISGLFVFLSLVLPYAKLIILMVPFAAFLSVWGLFVGIFSWYKGIPAARWYTISWAGLLFGVMVIAFSKFGIMPRNSITNNALQIGTLLEVVLLSFALAERISKERSLRLRAQLRAYEIQKLATEELEKRVAERTEELEIANRQLRYLSDTDQLTGLKNRRCLEKFLQKEFSRAKRHERFVAVMLLDVDHFKQVNDTYGHMVGDDCLQEVALHIESEIRDSDIVARYGGEEFCVVLLEPDSKKATDVAERVRKSIESMSFSTQEGKLKITISIGCAVGVPEDKHMASEFLEKADNALYQSKEGGRNQVSVIHMSEN